eukprot:TRINITY_DN11118_c0_g1_i1.p1 TRINITY_DN11118_c0_g1~~TRINITY_DN11118_c0_g1_i1.p1  ORF type:complete len:137 (+),score=41.22 TRINITY_DN11118_c0_g1_i1:57-467(+)
MSSRKTTKKTTKSGTTATTTKTTSNRKPKAPKKKDEEESSEFEYESSNADTIKLVDVLKKSKYRRLQTIAKKHGIKGNQKTKVLMKAILDKFEESDLSFDDFLGRKAKKPRDASKPAGRINDDLHSGVHYKELSDD